MPLKGLTTLANHLERFHNGFKTGSDGGYLMRESAQLACSKLESFLLFYGFEGLGVDTTWTLSGSIGLLGRILYRHRWCWCAVE